MKRPGVTPGAAACALVLLAASVGRADPIVWSESCGAPPGVLAANGLGGLYLSASQGPQTVSGSSEVIAASLQLFYSPLVWTPPPFPPGPPYPPVPPPQPTDDVQFHHDPFKLVLFIQDADTGVVGSLTFAGQVNGTFSPLHSDVTVLVAAQPQTLHLGHHLFQVAIDHVTPPGLLGDPPGSISAHVKVTHNPEPSGLALAALGGPCLALTLWRRWRGPRRRG